MNDKKKSILKGNRFILFAFLLAWSYLAISAFYQHFPLGFKPLKSLSTDLLLFFIIELSAIGVGARIMKILDIEESGFVRNLGISFGFGMCGIGILYTLLGFLHLIYPLTAIIILILLLIAGSRDLITLFKDIEPNKSFTKHSLILIVPIFLLIIKLPMVLAPVVSHDALVYHMAVPKQIIKHGGFFSIPYNSHANFPFYIEMIYTFAISLGSGTLAKLINFSFAAILLFTLPDLLKDYIPRKYLFPGVLVFFTMPVVLNASTWALVDLPLTFYFLLTCLFMYRFLKEGSRKYLITAAIFAGFSAGIKYSALLFLFALILGWLYNKRKNFFSKSNMKALLLFTIILLVICSPWYIKNLLNFGNPVYPLTFSGAEELLYNKGKAFNLWNPFERIYDYAVGENHIDEVIGFLVLIFFPLIIFFKRNKLEDFLAIVSLGSLILTIVIFSPSVRVILPVIFLLSILSGTVIGKMWNKRLIFKATTLFLIVLYIGSMIPLYLSGRQIFDPATVVFGKENKEAYLSRIFTEYDVIKYANEHLKKSKIIFLGCHATYYADFDYISSAPVDPPPLQDKLEKAKNGTHLLNTLLNEGYTHIILDERDLEEFSSMKHGEKLLYILNHASTVFRNENIVLLKLNRK